MARVLGVDPGFASFGWCVVDLRREGDVLLGVGVIRTKKANPKQNVSATEDNLVRTRSIYRDLVELCTRYDVRVIGAEAMSHGMHNAGSAAKVSMAWGAIAALSEERGLPVVQVHPKSLKKLLTGSASATKDDVANVVLQRFPGSPLDGFYADTPKTEQEHGFDAIAVVLACANSEVFRMARG